MINHNLGINLAIIALMHCNFYIFIVCFIGVVQAQVPYIDLPEPLPAYYEKNVQAKSELMQWANNQCEDHARDDNPWFSKFLRKAVQFKKDPQDKLHVYFGVKVTLFDYKQKSYIAADYGESNKLMNRVNNIIHTGNLSGKVKKIWRETMEQLNLAGQSLGVFFHGDIVFCNDGLTGDCSFVDTNAKYASYFNVQLRKAKDPYWQESGELFEYTSRKGKIKRSPREHAYLSRYYLPEISGESASSGVLRFDMKMDPSHQVEKKETPKPDRTSEAASDATTYASSILSVDSKNEAWLHELGHYLLLNDDAYPEFKIGYEGYPTLSHLNAYNAEFKMDPIEVATFLLRFNQEIPNWNSFVTKAP